MTGVNIIQNLPILEPRSKESHKGNYGHVFIVAGAIGMIGAACLTTRAALRSGAGLVTLGTPKSLVPVASVKLTCAMTFPLSETSSQTIARDSEPAILKFAQGCDAMALGPGISQNLETRDLVRDIVPKIAIPLVIDADGLNALAPDPSSLLARPYPTIITPHPGEFGRLTGKSIKDIQKNREEYAVEFAKKFNSVIILKGWRSVVTDGEHIFINSTGNPGMATGGSGDVLTGVVTALVGQGLSAFNAATLGTWIHGLAGDMACAELGEIGMIATDLIKWLPAAFQSYRQKYS